MTLKSSNNNDSLTNKEFLLENFNFLKSINLKNINLPQLEDIEVIEKLERILDIKIIRKSEELVNETDFKINKILLKYETNIEKKTMSSTWKEWWTLTTSKLKTLISLEINNLNNKIKN